MTYLQRFTARLGVFVRRFLRPDPYPQTPATIARAKDVQAADRTKYRVDVDGHPLLIRGLGEIQQATKDNLRQFADHQPSGYAFTFKPKDK